MRPHNSGHWTIEGARTSQFEQHLRAVLDYPLGATAPTAPVVVMANVLGAAAPVAMSLDERVHHLFARFPDVKVHLYGKAERPGRKIGHVTVAGRPAGRGARPGRAGRRMARDGRRGPTGGRRTTPTPARPDCREGWCPVPDPLVGVIMGSDSDWPVMSAAAEALAEFAVPYEVGVVLRAPHAAADARLRDVARRAAACG